MATLCQSVHYLNNCISLILIICLLVARVHSQCPWSRELVDLHSDCVCAYNSVQRLSIQCSPVNFLRLTAALRSSVQNIPIDLLYINNSTLDVIPEAAFRSLDIQALHISRSRIKDIHPKAFKGLENKLGSLSLPDNHLSAVPTEALATLRNLQQLDLSNNNITLIPKGAFEKIPLTTLKLADNRLTIAEGGLQGLEATLKNLNLKGAQLDQLPTAIHNLSVLAFLDLAQNKITRLEAGSLANLHTLTALNLERNKISSLNEGDFIGVNDTLSSLSLLNNQLEQFPKKALSTLAELRVLDLGFNRIRTLPLDAFRDNPLLTLLALDGNPMETIPEAAFSHLSSILRGLSIGGSHLVCDCRVRWIAEWIKENNLQVTSRERNPQFCGKPDNFRRKSFLQISPDEFACEDESVLTTKRVLVTTTTATTQARKSTSRQATSTTKGPRKHSDREDNENSFPIRPSSSSTVKVFTPAQETTTLSTSSSKSSASSSSAHQSGPPVAVTPSRPLTVHSRSKNGNSGARIPYPVTEEVKIVDAYRQDSSVVIEWDSQSTNILGFQVVYRYFGDNEFKRGQPLPPGHRRYILQNLPVNECLVVCVVTLEDTPNLSVDAIPYSQCREIKTMERASRTAELDKIVIGASAAVCAIIIVAVLIFACCYHRNRKKPAHAMASPPHSPKVNGLPALKSEHEWETISMYSGRSIPRARMYHMDPSGNGSVNQSFVLDTDQRSHISHYSQMPNGYPKSSRPTADGQSHRSYSQLSSRFATTNGLGNPELRKSQQSLSQLSGHHSFVGSHMSAPKKKSRSSNGRLTSASSLHSLTEYDSDWNAGPRLENWKDNEVDIYVGQNHVVPTHGKYRKDYGPR